MNKEYLKAGEYYCWNYDSFITEEETTKEESPRKVKVELDSRAYSLDEISKVINANYEKEDALEIIKTIKSIK